MEDRGDEYAFFKNDYGQGCIPEILELLSKTNDESINGYGQDPYCKEAEELIRSKMPDSQVDVHFIVGGTLSNISMIKHLLRPFEAVIACDTGHIATHETGSIEATGHKVITVPNASGKLSASAIRKSMTITCSNLSTWSFLKPSIYQTRPN